MFTVQPPPRCCSPHTSGIAVSPDMWHEFSAPIAATCDWPEVPAIEICGWRHSLAMSGYAVDETPPMAFTACRSLVLWFLSVHSTSGIAIQPLLCGGHGVCSIIEITQATPQNPIKNATKLILNELRLNAFSIITPLMYMSHMAVPSAILMGWGPRQTPAGIYSLRPMSHSAAARLCAECQAYCC